MAQLSRQNLIWIAIIATANLLAIGLLLHTIKLDGSERPAQFSLSFTTYNHAEQMFNGITTFKLADNALTIRRKYMFSDEDTLLFSKKIDKNSLEQIKNIRLDSLQDFYFNYCIMATSGNEYFVSTTVDTITKKISLHHYYNSQIERLINELNKHVPYTLKHNYLTKDTQQDCKP